MPYIITKYKKDKSDPKTYLHKNRLQFVDRKSNQIGVFDYLEACRITDRMPSDDYYYLKTFVS